MAERRTGVRLDLTNSGFTSKMAEARRTAQDFIRSVDDIGGAAERSSRKTSGFFSAMKAGASGARGALSEFGGHLKQTLTLAATLGGSISIGAAANEARTLSASYKDLAFSIRMGTGEAMSANQVQGDVTAVADRWKRSNREVQKSYSDIFQETNNLEFSKKAIDSVAKAANASGKSVDTLSNIAGTLNEKFGIGASDIDDSMATILELGNKGGASLEDMGAKLGIVGASAKMLGMSGRTGLQQVVGMLNIADDATGSFKKSLAATTALFEGLADPDRAKNIQKALGVNILDKGGSMRQDAIERILAKTKGKKEELAKVFGGEELKLLVALGQNFSKAFDETKGDVKTKTAAAIEAYRHALTDAGKATFTGADMTKEAADRNNDAQRNMQDAMNKFVAAFEKPEMIHAMDQLAAAAPKVAKVFGALVEFATKHPVLAGAGAIGAVAAKGALTGMVTKVGEGVMEGAGEKLAKAAAAHPNWAMAGGVLGAAAAGLIAFQITKHLAEASLKEDEMRLSDLDEASSTVESMVKHGTGTPEQRAKAAAALRQQIERADTTEPGIISGMSSLFAPEGEGIGARTGEKLARAREHLLALERKPKKPVSFFGGDGFNPNNPFGAPIGPPPPPAAGGPSADAKKLANELANGEPRKVVMTNEQAFASAVARQMGSVTLRVTVAGGGSGTNGLPPAPGNGSGSAPR